MAGIGLALTTIRPQIALLLAIPFLFKQRRVWWWFLAGSAVLVVFSILLVGITGVGTLLHILTISAGGTGYKINEIAMMNFIGLLDRLAPGISPGAARLMGWIVYAAAIVLACIIWIRSKNIGEKQIGTAVLIAIISAPHLHYHDLVLLLIPIFCVMILINQRYPQATRTLLLLPLVTSWLLLISNSIMAVRASLPYILGLALVILLWRPELVLNKNKEQP